MTHDYPALIEPLHLRGGVTLRNRMCSAPMGFPELTEDGCLTEGAIAFYEHRAKGGTAMVTISEGNVDIATGKSHGRCIDLKNPAVISSLTNCARAIKRHGAVASVELSHGGMLSDFDIPMEDRGAVRRRHFGASPLTLPDGTQVEEMSREMIASIVDSFAKGALVCKRAGFDMVLVHAGHGWLLHQFLSPLTNHRTDEYGGSVENRARFTMEVLDAIRATAKDMPIELRFSGMETEEGGITIEDAITFAKLVQDKADILHVSAGTDTDFGTIHPPMFSKPGCNVHLAAEIRKHVHTPVATIGAIGDPEHMEEILESGQADIICMARALLADPELPRKVEQNRTDEIVPCIRCFTCHAERAMTQTRICALNPQIGREYEAKFEVSRTDTPKRVLVAGGGPGGMESALTAARRGHHVTLCEATERLGGNLNCEEGVSFKANFAKYIAVMSRLMEKAGVKVRLNTAVTPEFVEAFAPDALIVALGAEALIPPIPGIDGKNVVLGTELAQRIEDIGQRVAVIGGGLVGCECGLHLAMEGRDVTIVEQRNELAPDANIRHRPILLSKLEEHTQIMTGLTVVEVKDDGLVCRDEAGLEKYVPADTVLCAAGLKPRRAAADALRGTAPIVEVIGDCVKPDIIRGATFRGYHAALDI